MLIYKLRKAIKRSRSDKYPYRRLVGLLFMALPFDLGRVLRINLRVHDFIIRFHVSSMAIDYWCNPTSRESDYIFLNSYLRSDDIYIDIGANIGTTLIPAAKVVRAGKVIGIEPHPRIFSYLKENLVINGLLDVELYNCALGKQHGYVSFSDLKNDDTNRVVQNGKGIKVPVIMLDDITQNYSHIDLLKIDVEGYEKFVIEGGINSIAKTDCLYIEISEEHFKSFGYSVADLLSTLYKEGFSLLIKTNLGLLKYIDSQYRPPTNTLNVIAARDVNKFLERTGWRLES